MFLGLLLKMEMVASEEGRSRVFDLTVATVTVFVFVFPVATMLFTSEKARNMIASRFMKLASKLAFCLWRQSRRTAPASNAAGSNVRNSATAEAPDGISTMATTTATKPSSAPQRSQTSPAHLFLPTTQQPLPPRKAPPVSLSASGRSRLRLPPLRPPAAHQRSVVEDTASSSPV